jgi:hypothetical protein
VHKVLCDTKRSCVLHHRKAWRMCALVLVGLCNRWTFSYAAHLNALQSHGHVIGRALPSVNGSHIVTLSVDVRCWLVVLEFYLCSDVMPAVFPCLLISADASICKVDDQTKPRTSVTRHVPIIATKFKKRLCQKEVAVKASKVSQGFRIASLITRVRVIKELRRKSPRKPSKNYGARIKGESFLR